MISNRKSYEIQVNTPPPMAWEEYESIVLAEWETVLSKTNLQEAEIQGFLEKHPCMIPGAFGELTPSGHSPFPAAVISQPELRGLVIRIPDFMWLATNSEFVHPILIEIERADKRWFTKKGKPTAQFTQAHDQLAEWKAWFNKPQNQVQFINHYRFPPHFRHGRTFKPIYVLIYGRREEATQHSILAEKRGQLQGKDEVLMSFDRLQPQYDCRELFSIRVNIDGFVAISVPPTFRLGPALAEYRLEIQDKARAVEENIYLSRERKDFLTSRLDYWDNWALAHRNVSKFMNSGDWE